MTHVGPRPEGGAERRELILSTLQSVSFLPIAELARELAVSQMTIRRDLHALEDAGKVRMFHGGAALAPGCAPHSAFPDDHEAAADQRIGVFAAGLVDDGDTVVIDAGPTAYALARALPDDFSGCVITNSMPVLQFFDERGTARTLALGGELLPDRHAFIGPTTEAMVAGLRARTYFLAPPAIDARGLYARSAAEASLQRKLLDIADRVVVLATRQAFSSSAPAKVAPLDRLTAVVTDEGPPADVAVVLRRLGVIPHIVRA